MEEFATEPVSTKIWTRDDIKSLDDLKAFYRECQYGIIDFKAGKPWKETHKNTFFKDWEENWKLLSVDQLLKFKCGVCYDTAKANDYFLTKFKVEHVNLFAMTKRNVEAADYNDDPTHTFTVYKDEGGKWKWLEASWGTHKNNTLSESSSDKIVRKIGQLLANASGQTNYIGIVQSFPPDGTNMADFYNAMKRYVVYPKWTAKPDSSAMEDFSQENFGVKDDRFVKDVILPAIKDDTLYHGSSQKLSVIKPFQLKEFRDKNVKTISLTPYARLASLFCVPFRSIRENDKGQVIFHHCRMKLDEWFEDMPEDEMYKSVQTVHVSHNIKQLEPIDKTYTGYLHYVHAEDALVDAGSNPINGKGPYEVVSYVKELKPYKVETIKIRMIAKYNSSFAKECGVDAEPCDPEDIATEDFAEEGFFDKIKNAVLASGRTWYACVIDNATYNTPKDVKNGIEVFASWNAALEQALINSVMDSRDVVYNGNYSLRRSGNNVILKCDKKHIKSVKEQSSNVTATVFALSDKEVDNAEKVTYGPYQPNNAKRVAKVVHNVDPNKYFSSKEDIAFEVKLVESHEIYATEDFEPDTAIEIISELNEGIEEFKQWIKQHELSVAYESIDDAQTKQVIYSLSQENILVRTVKEIFRKIAQFIGWFFRKLKELWNFFFGRMQRKIRMYNSMRETLKKYIASNVFFNEKAFRDLKAPAGMAISDEVMAMMEEAYVPDKLYEIFKEIYDLWEKDPLKLHEIMTVELVNQGAQHRFYPLRHTGYGNGVGKGIDDIIMKYFPAKGTMLEAGFTCLADVDEYCKYIDVALKAYYSISKIFSSHGDIMAQAQRRMLEYADRTDITEKEAAEMANKVQGLSGILKNITSIYIKSFEFILDQGIMSMNVAFKYVKK
jgi:hypothetical protein